MSGSGERAEFERRVREAAKAAYLRCRGIGEFDFVEAVTPEIMALLSPAQPAPDSQPPASKVARMIWCRKCGQAEGLCSCEAGYTDKAVTPMADASRKWPNDNDRFGTDVTNGRAGASQPPAPTNSPTEDVTRSHNSPLFRNAQPGGVEESRHTFGWFHPGAPGDAFEAQPLADGLREFMEMVSAKVDSMIHTAYASTRTQAGDDLTELEQWLDEQKAALAARVPQAVETREQKATRLVKESGKSVHSNTCATSVAPAEEPGPCDCAEVQPATNEHRCTYCAQPTTTKMWLHPECMNKYNLSERERIRAEAAAPPAGEGSKGCKYCDDPKKWQPRYLSKATGFYWHRNIEDDISVQCAIRVAAGEGSQK